MLAYGLFCFPQNDIGLPPATMKKLRVSNPDKRRRLCLKLIPSCATLENIRSPLHRY